MKLVLIYGAVFAGTLVFVDTLIRYSLMKVRQQKYVNYRLKLLEGAADHRSVYEGMLRERRISYGKKDYYWGWGSRFLQQSGLKNDYRKMAIYSLTYVFAGWFLLGFLVVSPVYRFGALLLIAALIVLLIIFRARASRIKSFVTQLPEAIDIIVRSLSAGHPLPTSINLVAREMSDPIGSEFGLLNDELKYGLEMESALRNLISRVGAEDLKFFAISLTVQKGTGGNLIEVLSNLADVLRQRGLLKGKIRALSAEGRFTSWVMLAFPFFLYSMLRMLVPDYFDPIWASGYGNTIVAAGMFVMLVGMLVLRKMVNFDI